MPLTWDVQPYRYLNELRNAYALSIFSATRKHAGKYARDIEKWMKQNAPWQDRTVEERINAYLSRAGKRMEHFSGSTGPVPPHYMRGARAGLKAVIVISKQEQDITAQYRVAMSRAPALKDYWMKNTNADREARGLRRYKRMPKSKDFAAAARRELRSKRPPLLKIQINHEEDLHYAIWLEIAHGGRYNIIKRTLEHWLPKIMADIRGFANLKQYRNREGIIPHVPTEQESFNRFVADEERVSGKKYTPWSQEVKEKRETRRRREYTPQMRAEKAALRREASERKQLAKRLAREEEDRQQRLAAIRATATTTRERRELETKFWDEERRKQIQKGLEEAKRRKEGSSPSN